MDDASCLLILQTAVAQYSNMSEHNPYTIKLYDVYVIMTEKTSRYFQASMKTTVNDNRFYLCYYEWKTGTITIRVFEEVDKLSVKRGENYV